MRGRVESSSPAIFLRLAASGRRKIYVHPLNSNAFTGKLIFTRSFAVFRASLTTRRPMYRNPLFKNYNICGGGSAVCCGRQVQEAVLFSRPGHGLARRRRRRRQRDEERRRPRSHSRSNFAFTNIEYFAQVLSIFLCNFKTSEVFCFVSYFFAKMINDLLQFTYLSISND